MLAQIKWPSLLVSLLVRLLLLYPYLSDTLSLSILVDNVSVETDLALSHQLALCA